MTMKILSIDGGGIRGIIPGQILVSLENKLKTKTNNDNARLSDFFDLFAGTSTGAILSAAYVMPDVNANGRPKFTAQEAVNLYIDEGDEIFDVDFWQYLSSLNGLNDETYSAKALESILKHSFNDIKLSELLKPTCFVSYDIRSRQQVVFKQHTAGKQKPDFLVRDLLRGSSAAPTYFETAKIYSLPPMRKKHVLIDGGMVANDPTLCAYSEAIKFEHVSGIKDMLILSLGTGKELKSYSHSQVKDWGPLGWAKPSIDIALEGGPQMTQYHMKQIASTETNAVYRRIQPDLFDAKPDLDDASIKNLKALKDAGIRNAEIYDEVLNEIADLLIQNDN